MCFCKQIQRKLMEETGENHRPVASHWQLYHIMLYLAWERFELTTLVVIGTDCIGSYKFNYNAITTTTHPLPAFSLALCSTLNMLFHHHILIVQNSQNLREQNNWLFVKIKRHTTCVFVNKYSEKCSYAIWQRHVFL
jgi:hypothetical protein